MVFSYGMPLLSSFYIVADSAVVIFRLAHSNMSRVDSSHELRLSLVFLATWQLKASDDRRVTAEGLQLESASVEFYPALAI